MGDSGSEYEPTDDGEEEDPDDDGLEQDASGACAQILVKTLTGKTITMDVKASDTIACFQRMVEDAEGTPPSLQRLVVHEIGAKGHPKRIPPTHQLCVKVWSPFVV